MGGGPPPRHYDDRPPLRHYEDRGPPRHYEDRYAPPLDRYADRYGPPPPRRYDDHGAPPPRHYEDRYGSSGSSRGGSRYYEERSYDRRPGADRYGGRVGLTDTTAAETRIEMIGMAVQVTALVGLVLQAPTTGIPGHGGITEAAAGVMSGRQDQLCLLDRHYLQDTERGAVEKAFPS